MSKRLTDQDQRRIDVHHEHEAMQVMAPGLVTDLHRAAFVLGIQRSSDARLAAYARLIADEIVRCHMRRHLRQLRACRS